MSHPVLEALRSPDVVQRRDACRNAASDPSAVLLVDALGEALADPAREVSRAAADALTAIALRQRGVEETLRRALRSDHPVRRFRAAAVLARLSPPSPSLLPALVEALAHPEGDVRWGAARLLVDTGRLHGEVLGILLGLLQADPRPRVRRMAAFAAGTLAPDDPACAEALRKASEDTDPNVKRAALTAMASLLDPPDAVRTRLLAALDADADPASRRIATVTLSSLGAANPGWLPAEAEHRLAQLAAERPDPDRRRGATRALERLAAAASEAGGPG